MIKYETQTVISPRTGIPYLVIVPTDYRVPNIFKTKPDLLKTTHKVTIGGIVILTGEVVSSNVFNSAIQIIKNALEVSSN